MRTKCVCEYRIYFSICLASQIEPHWEIQSFRENIKWTKLRKNPFYIKSVCIICIIYKKNPFGWQMCNDTRKNHWLVEQKYRAPHPINFIHTALQRSTKVQAHTHRDIIVGWIYWIVVQSNLDRINPNRRQQKRTANKCNCLSMQVLSSTVWRCNGSCQPHCRDDNLWSRVNRYSFFCRVRIHKFTHWQKKN